jgi:uncharacterized membrane protein YphA (DoxX/SURF4 family)
MTIRAKNITYWTTTILVAFLIGSGGAMQVARVPATVDGFVRILHYPAYFVIILGVWKVLGAIAILVPRYPRLKEWAYAGIFFDLTGAAASNAAVGGYGAYGFHIIAPLILTALTIASWALRPESRKLVILTPANIAATERQSN